MRKLKALLLLLFTGSLAVSGQSVLRGYVYGPDRRTAVSGASLRLGSGPRAATGRDGYFTIGPTGAGDSLFITGVGFAEQRLAVAALTADTLRIVMTLAGGQMEEVTISTGYQLLPKERATGSFNLVNNKLLNQQVGTGILDRLVGVAPDVLAPAKADGPLLTIRGLSTIQGPKNPLIILDNFPYEGDISNVNPNDVESISLLKDAAAASIWGTRAGNGVIVITTKKGRFSRPLQLALNSVVTVTGKPDLYYPSQTSVADFIDLEQTLYAKGFYTAAINSTSRPALSPVVEILVKRDKGQLSAADAAAQIAQLKLTDSRRDYEQYVYSHAVKQQYALNLSGGSSTANYYISGGYDRNLSDLKAGYNRTSLNIKNTVRPFEKLTITTGLLYTGSKATTGRAAYDGKGVTVGNKRLPYAALAGADGTPLRIARDYRSAYTDTAGGGKLLNWNYYPLTDYEHDRSTTTLNDLVGNLSLQYNPIPALTLTAAYQYERQSVNSCGLQDTGSYAARNLINKFSQVSGGVVNYIVPLGGILSLSQTTLESQNGRLQVAFNKTYSEHEVSALGGAEARQTRSRSNGYKVYGYNDDILTSANVDFRNTYPNLVTGNYESIDNGVTLADGLNRFLSFYANGSYTYRRKYTATLSGRRDASNLFGVHTNDKWTPLWSAGLAWTLSGEDFYQWDLLPYLKLRATYGFSGNVDQSRSAVTTLRFTGADNLTNLPGAQVEQFANPELRWEKVGMLNIGLDFGSRSERITGTLEYYTKKGIDLFGQALVDYTSGVNRSGLLANVASMRGRGLNLELNTLNTSGKLLWTTRLIFDYNTSRTTSYNRSVYTASSYLNDGTYISPIEGKPLYSVISYPYAGLDAAGNPQGYVGKDISKDYNGIANLPNGLTSLVYNGPALPPFFGSLGNTLSWKGLSLTANLTYKLGYYFRRPSINYSSLANSGLGNADYALRWQQPGDEAKTVVPSFVYPLQAARDAFYNASEVTVRKGDHIRLQFINAAYDLPLKIQKLSFQHVQVYLNASNLGIIWRANKDGIDPDAIFSIPSPKSIACGIRATF